jgi:hypothetical protein
MTQESYKFRNDNKRDATKLESERPCVPLSYSTLKCPDGAELDAAALVGSRSTW